MLSPVTAAQWYNESNIGRSRFIAALEKGQAAYFHLIRQREDETIQSNMTLPVTTISVNRLAPKLLQLVAPRGTLLNIPGVPQAAIESFMNALTVAKIRRALRSWIKRIILDGTGVIMPYWENTWERVKESVFFEISDEERYLLEQGDKKLRQELFLSTFGNSVRTWAFQENGDIKAEIAHAGGEYEVFAVKFRTKPGEVEMATIGDRLVYSGLKFDVIPIYNLYFHVDAPSLDEAPFVIYKQFSSVQRLWQYVDDKDKLTFAAGKQYMAEGPRSRAEGAVSQLGANLQPTTRSEVVEFWQVFHGGKISWVLPCSQYTFQEMDIEDEFPRQLQRRRRPFFVSQFMEITPGLVYGWSLPLLLWQYQKELDYLNNATNDAVDIMSSIIGGYRPSRFSLDQPKKIRLERNTLIPIDSRDDLVLFNAAPNLAWAMQKMVLYSQETERLSSVDDITLGRGSPVGASRGQKTLGGLQLMLGQRQEIYMDIASAIREEYEELLSGAFSIWIKNMPAKMLASLGIRKMPLGSSVIVDSDMESIQQSISRSISLYQILRDPLFLQLGITKPEGLARIAIDITKAMGKNPRHYINMPVSRDAVDDIKELLNGAVPVPGTIDNHQQHISKEAIAMADAPAGIKENFQKHIALHASMLEYLQRMPQEVTAGKYQPQIVL